MKEFFALLKQFDLKGIFLTPTKNGFLQFFRYLFVDGIAKVVVLVWNYLARKILLYKN